MKKLPLGLLFIFINVACCSSKELRTAYPIWGYPMLYSQWSQVHNPYWRSLTAQSKWWHCHWVPRFLNGDFYIQQGLQFVYSSLHQLFCWCRLEELCIGLFSPTESIGSSGVVSHHHWSHTLPALVSWGKAQHWPWLYPLSALWWFIGCSHHPQYCVLVLSECSDGHRPLVTA